MPWLLLFWLVAFLLQVSAAFAPAALHSLLENCKFCCPQIAPSVPPGRVAATAASFLTRLPAALCSAPC